MQVCLRVNKNKTLHKLSLCLKVWESLFKASGLPTVLLVTIPDLHQGLHWRPEETSGCNLCNARYFKTISYFDYMNY